MLFNSYLFVFLFLPFCLAAVAAGQRFSRDKGVLRAVVVCMSLVFYAYWKVDYLALLLGSIVVNYAFIRGLGSMGVRPAVALSCLFNLGLLVFYKYWNFAASNLNAVFGGGLEAMDVALPLAISFFTFQQIACIVDVARGDAEVRSFSDYLTFVCFFPQLIAGPICRYNELAPQLSGIRVTGDGLRTGLSLFVLGLAKKVLVADTLAGFVDPYYASGGAGAPDFFNAWFAAIFFTGQIYYDFSGYTDMALGLGRMFGVELPINFDSPLKARSIVDFWRRWHITLSLFLRDYLYIPLGGNRKGRGRQVVNIGLTMFLGGLWHGANWTFVLWGVLHGAFLAVNHWFARAMRNESPGLFLRYAAWCLTFTCVIGAFVVFRAPSLDVAQGIWKGMAGLNGVSLALPHQLVPHVAFLQGLGVSLGGDAVDFALKGLACAALFLLLAMPNSRELALRLEGCPRGAYALSVLLVFSLMTMNRLAPFIYFEF